MTNNILKKNLKVLALKNSKLAKKIDLQVVEQSDYISFELSKTNKLIPIFTTGHFMYSKYNPEKEVESLFLTDDDFILFCGIGSGIQIEYFLKTYPEKKCAVTDISLNAYKSLFSNIDFTNIINDKRVQVLPAITDVDFKQKLAENYLPLIDGKLKVVSLRTWENFYSKSLSTIKAIVSNSLKEIETDFLTQSTFGKVWLKNILHNLQLLSTFKPELPTLPIKKTALICGAGPSLSKKIQEIKNNRSSFVIFATDTSFLPLMQNRIQADVFLSVDPQIYSLYHCSFKPPRKTIGVFDLCSLDILARSFFKAGNKIFFTVSNHPLAKHARTFAPLPFADSTSGTVAIYAFDVAHRLGFTKFKTVGLDFSYTDGKPYANGTYLEKKALSYCSKIFTAETFYTKLMFRGSTKKIYNNNDKITYQTEILSYYNAMAKNYKFNDKIWTNCDFKKFPYKSFFQSLYKDLKNKTSESYIYMLPFLSYCKYHKKKDTFALAIKTILKYNQKYE